MSIVIRIDAPSRKVTAQGLQAARLYLFALFGGRVETDIDSTDRPSIARIAVPLGRNNEHYYVNLTRLHMESWGQFFDRVTDEARKRFGLYGEAEIQWGTPSPWEPKDKNSVSIDGNVPSLDPLAVPDATGDPYGMVPGFVSSGVGRGPFVNSPSDLDKARDFYAKKDYERVLQPPVSSKTTSPLVLGYIVTIIENGNNKVGCRGQGYDRGDVLWFNGDPWIFDTREQAETAIRRTRAFGKVKGYDSWENTWKKAKIEEIL